MIYVLIANGFEETEAVATADILRRAGLGVKLAGLHEIAVSGAHGITVKCDITEGEIDVEDLEGIVLPGGMPGTKNLEKSERVKDLINYSCQNKKLVAAICAAPSILAHMGLLNGRNATVYPSFIKDLEKANYQNHPVVRDENIITADGPNSAILFGLEIVGYLKGREIQEKLRSSL